MAKLGPYFGTHAGTLEISLQMFIGQFDVGAGSFTLFTDTEVDFTGSYSALGYSGTFIISIKLTDGKPAATSGPCSVTLNTSTDTAATYEVNGAQLTIATKLNPTAVSIYANNGGTQINGISGHNLWIGPLTA